MARLTFGTTLLREWGAFVLCLADPKVLEATSDDYFQDKLLRQGLGAAKRIRVKAEQADIFTLRHVFKQVANVEGDGKLLDLLMERVKAETTTATQRAAISRLRTRMVEMTPEQLSKAIEALA